MQKGIIFDMDGLMINSETNCWEPAERRFVEDYGKEFKHEISKKYHGLRVQGMVEVMIREYKLPIDQKEGERKLKEYAKENFSKPTLELLPGCKKLIEDIHAKESFIMGVASSSPIEIIKTAIDRFSFNDYFKVLVSGEEVANGKPAPDVFLQISKLLNISPEHCLVLEDAPNGIKAAKTAGMKAIAVSNNGHYTGEDFKEADKFTNSLENINTEVIEDLFNH